MPADEKRLDLVGSPRVVHDQQPAAGSTRRVLARTVKEAAEMAPGLERVDERRTPPVEHLGELIDTSSEIRAGDLLAERRPQDAAGEPLQHLGIGTQSLGKGRFAQPAGTVQRRGHCHRPAVVRTQQIYQRPGQLGPRNRDPGQLWSHVHRSGARCPAGPDVRAARGKFDQSLVERSLETVRGGEVVRGHSGVHHLLPEHGLAWSVVEVDDGFRLDARLLVKQERQPGHAELSGRPELQLGVGDIG